MEKLIEQALNKYFSDFKEYHLLILIVFTIIIALIQIIQSLYVSRKIERFKNELKKSEIKFSKYTELQITALRKIYHQLATFQLANNLLFKVELNSINHSTLENRINEWIKIYMECSSEFAREKILLTQDMKDLFSKTISDFEMVKGTLIDEKRNLDYLEKAHQGNWNDMYDFEENELKVISDKIERIKEKDFIEKADKHIRVLREKIEEHFLKMN